MKPRAVLILLLLAVPANAQEKPEAPKPKPHSATVFWLGTAALAASKTFDATETRSLLDRGGHENNPVFGRHPSPAKQGLINAAFFAGQTFLFYKTEHSRHKWLRWTGRAYLTFTAEEHYRLGVCNAGINTQAPMRNCHPAF